ncbi:conserved protein [Tepidicaulis marinus]|uniref:Conserved protein n=1 Tax=Tepidicaulis marinus TaxID=1333998 RepID=A0A081BFP6_9HYPH|nr:hypothetical protein [Tepidicaulis marinus]GAK46864.1 conserved protein [Tepidicaulis marinus]
MSVLDTPPPPPLTMDSLEELRAYLWKVHQVTVDQNDPILMLHTIHKVALDEYARLLDGHKRQLSENVEKITKDLCDEVRLIIGDLEADALNDAVRERLATIHEAERLSGKTLAHLKQTLKAQRLLTLINFAALGCALGVLSVLVI